MAVANEPAYLESAEQFFSTFTGFRTRRRSRPDAEQCRHYVAQNQTELFGLSYAPAEALVCLLQGDLGAGMTLLQRSSGLAGLFGVSRRSTGPFATTDGYPGNRRHSVLSPVTRVRPPPWSDCAPPCPTPSYRFSRSARAAWAARPSAHRRPRARQAGEPLGQHDEAARLARRALPIIDAYPRPTAAADQLRTLAQGHPTASGRGETRASLDGA